MPGYVVNSSTALTAIKQLGQLPPAAKVFSSDATAMYANIDPDKGIPAAKKYIYLFGNECSQHIPTELIINLLDLVLQNTVFQFGDSWWLQKIGTAMGTPCACIYATLFFSYFERTILLKKY